MEDNKFLKQNVGDGMRITADYMEKALCWSPIRVEDGVRLRMPISERLSSST